MAGRKTASSAVMPRAHLRGVGLEQSLGLTKLLTHQGDAPTADLAFFVSCPRLPDNPIIFCSEGFEQLTGCVFTESAPATIVRL